MGLLAAGCGSSSGGGSAGSGASGSASGGSKSAIKVEGISTLTGGIPFVGIPQGAQAYFKMINSEGGVQGHKIDYTSNNDVGNPGTAAQLARKAILQDGADAIVTNTSLVDCQSNANFYKSEHIGVIGLGAEPACFNQANWMPINDGPFVGAEVLWHFAFDNLHIKRVCSIGQNEPNSIPYYKQLEAAYEKSSGNKFTLYDFNNNPSESPTPDVVAAKSANCQALILSTVAPNLVAFVKAAKAVGFDGTILDLGSGYDATVPPSLGKLADAGGLGPDSKGIFVNSELAPFTPPYINSTVASMAAQFHKQKVALDFWTEGGYLIAQTFVDVLKSINGPITRQSILAAEQKMKPFSTGLAGSPEEFGSGARHNPDLSSMMMTIKNGKWMPVTGKYLTIKPLPVPAS